MAIVSCGYVALRVIVRSNLLIFSALRGGGEVAIKATCYGEHVEASELGMGKRSLLGQITITDSAVGTTLR